MTFLRMLRSSSALALGAALLLVIGACSVAEYETPISQFSSATQTAENALVDLNEEITNAKKDYLTRGLLTRRTWVLQTGKSDENVQDCTVGAMRCQHIVVDASSGENKGTLPPEPLLGNLVLLMRDIRIYAQGLTDIVIADTAAKVTENVNATVGSLNELNETVTKLQTEAEARSTEERGQPQKMEKKEVSLIEYATPVGAGVNWLVGNYIAKVKLDGLRRATRDAKPVVANAADVLEKTASEAAFIPRSDLADAVSERRDQFDGGRTMANLDALIVSASAYDDFLLARPESVFAAMNAAHVSLVDKIQGENVSLPEVAAKVENFVAEAQNFAAIIESLSAVSKKDSNGEQGEGS